MIHLVDIDNETGRTDLEVTEEQQDYVCSSLVMLGRAWLHRKLRPQVSMCYVEGNDASRKLFEQFGFVEVSHPWDEIFMERMR